LQSQQPSPAYPQYPNAYAYGSDHSDSSYGAPAVAVARRPAIGAQAATMLAGAAVVVLGCALTWLTLPEVYAASGIPQRWNGFTDVAGDAKDGYVFTVLAVIVAAFGITSLAAKRLLPVMITGIVLAGFGLVAAIVDVADITGIEGLPPGFEPSLGPGLPVVIAGFALSIGGFIAGLATRKQAR
jgi:hypothetical protein